MEQLDLKKLDERIINNLTNPVGPEEAVKLKSDIKMLVDFTFERVKNYSNADKRGELLKLLYFDPTNHIIMHTLGTCYLADGILEEARSFFHMALKTNPTYVDTLLEFGIFYRSIDNDLAILLLEKAYNLAPLDMRIVNTLGVLYVEVNKYEEGEKMFKQVLEFINNKCSNIILTPEHPLYDIKFKVLGNLGTTLSSMGHNSESLKYITMSEEMCITTNHHQTKLLVMNNMYPEEVGNIIQTSGRNEYYKIYNEHIKINKLVAFQNIYDFKDRIENRINKNKNKNKDNNNNNNNKIRIGYVSSDFRNHVVSKFMYNIIDCHDRQKFDVYCYYNFKVNDPYTHFYASKGNFKNIHNKDTKEASKIIYDDEIDILVDLNGNTSGSRVDVFAAKPAPIQISYLGYPNTSGLFQMDYRITDTIADNIDTEQKYTEKLIRLNTCFINYNWNNNNNLSTDVDSIINSSKAVMEPNKLKEYTKVHGGFDGYITFGVINRPSKNSVQYLNCIKKIFDRVPNSILLIKINTLCEQARIKKYYMDFLGLVDERRLIIKIYNINQNAYYDLFNDIDILLDTFPYSGTTTTCDSLYMSTPVVTLYNKNCHSHNVSSSIISRLEPFEFGDTVIDAKNDLISYSEDEYVEKCVHLSENLELIKAYKTNLRSLFMKSMDPAKFMKEYEGALENLV